MTYAELADIVAHNRHTTSGFKLVATGPDREQRFENTDGFAVVTCGQHIGAPGVHRDWLGDPEALDLIKRELGGIDDNLTDPRFVYVEASVRGLAEERLVTPEVMAEIKEYQQLPRQHANWFYWPDQQGEERGVLEYFLDPAVHGGAHSFDRCRQDDDTNAPPDAWVSSQEGREAALELTQIVNEKAITKQIRMGKKKEVSWAESLADNRSYSTEIEKWSDRDYFRTCVNESIQKKAETCAGLFALGHPVQLLLYSDEMYLTDSYREHFASGLGIKRGKFQRVWLLVSHDPATGKERLVKLA